MWVTNKSILQSGGTGHDLLHRSICLMLRSLYLSLKYDKSLKSLYFEVCEPKVPSAHKPRILAFQTF